MRGVHTSVTQTCKHATDTVACNAITQNYGYGIQLARQSASVTHSRGKAGGKRWPDLCHSGLYRLQSHHVQLGSIAMRTLQKVLLNSLTLGPGVAATTQHAEESSLDNGKHKSGHRQTPAVWWDSPSKL